jgi:DNA-binding NarL/FixJ family response regulator
MRLSQNGASSGSSTLVNGFATDAPGLAGERSVDHGPGNGQIVVVHRRAMDRECLARSLQEHNPALDIAAVGSLDEVKAMGQPDPAAILLVLSDRAATESTAQAEMHAFASQYGGVPVVVLADAAGPAEILAALDAGAKGYVSTSASVKVLAEAIALARSGGTFVPASCILGLKSVIAEKLQGGSLVSGMFTNRQTSVANALKQGKANKIIAYELNMCESTVKVHVRHIMKKLGASNRTQVAYKLSEMAA